MAKTANPGTGCFSAVLRRVLCDGGSQTHPSDYYIPEPETSQFYEETTENESKINDDARTQASSSTITPNVVARLMGLDSLPKTDWVRYEKPPGSVTRSRSVNFMEYMLKFDNKDDGETQHRRVKTSVSFRELPCSARNPEKQDVLLLYLGKLDHKREIELKLRKSEKGFEESKQKKAAKGKDKEIINKKEKDGKYNKIKVSKKFKDEPRQACKSKKPDVGAKKVSRFVPPRQKDVYGKSSAVSVSKSSIICSKHRRNRVNPKNEETESTSEKSNSSPVSVLKLDLEEYLVHDEYSSLGDSEALDLDSKKRSSPSRSKKKDNDETDQYMVKLMKLLAKLSEEDIKKSTWVSKEASRFEEVEDLCIDFGQEIINKVLDQLLDELFSNDSITSS